MNLLRKNCHSIALRVIALFFKLALLTLKTAGSTSSITNFFCKVDYFDVGVTVLTPF